MKLLDALRIVNHAGNSSLPEMPFALACSFTPLALGTFLQAHLQQREAEARVSLATGLYGDLIGTLESFAVAERSWVGIAVALEWSDLDPRLTLRSSARTGAGFPEDVVKSAREMLARLMRRLPVLAARSPVVVSLPTLPLPPVFAVGDAGMSRAALQLRVLIADLAVSVLDLTNLRLVDSAALDVLSPLSIRGDLRSELTNGFPYTTAHADAVASAFSAALRPAAIKKGIITDLDNTLWRGIVGEIGATAVSWSREDGAHTHAIYQRCLDALASTGTLVAVASKNDPTVAQQALARDDLLITGDVLYPIEANWGPKSASVARVLQAWNVGSDSVIFVDDSALEVAEVQHAFPEIEGLVFDGTDASAVERVVARLRSACGKEQLREEDRIRVQSLRASAALHDSMDASSDQDAFLASLDARLSVQLSNVPDDGRALELINKTNQFNLNGRRLSAVELSEYLTQPGTFLMTVSYDDRFGPLGKIAAVLGRHKEGTVHISSWVMSCRAFSRRIEFATLHILWHEFHTRRMQFSIVSTDRNAPAQEFVAGLAPSTDANDVAELSELPLLPALTHSITVSRSLGNRTSSGSDAPPTDNP
jgi:FkbH-like protein